MTVGARVLIVNADDYGLTRRVSQGILRAHRHGIVTSTSVLAVAPAFATSVAWLADEPRLGVGAHLAAVGEDPPLLSAAEIPSLVDGRGRLAASWRQFLPRAAAGRIDPSDLAAEFSAQVEAVTESGVGLTHLDTHQHLHLWPGVRSVVLDMAEALGVALRVTRSAARSPVGVVVRRLSARLEAECRRRTIPFPAAAAGLDEAGALDGPTLLGAIRRLAAAPASSAELGSHPGAGDDPDRSRYRWNYRWEEELEALTSPLARRAVRDAGFVLGTYADLTSS